MKSMTKQKMALIVVALLALGGLLVFAQNLQKQSVEIGPVDEVKWGNSEITGDDGIKYIKKDDTECILIIGIDEAGKMEAEDSYLNDNLADALMLAVIDHKKKEYSILQIDRDTMTEIQVLGIGGDSAGKTKTQIARAFTYGTGMMDSSVNTVEAVSNLLCNAEIDHYATLSLDAIDVLNDEVDGVEVNIEDDFSKVDSSMHKGKLTLSGKQAQNYVRARMEMKEDTNIARMARQRNYLTKWIDAFKEKAEEDELFATQVMLDISDYYVSDLPPDIMADYAVTMTDYDDAGVMQIKGTSKTINGYDAFVADKKELEKQVISLLYNEK